jgi:hypothetical protein
LYRLSGKHSARHPDSIVIAGGKAEGPVLVSPDLLGDNQTRRLNIRRRILQKLEACDIPFAISINRDPMDYPCGNPSMTVDQREIEMDYRIRRLLGVT